jgi:RimJ/RimL family protein N-acetyltransferase
VLRVETEHGTRNTSTIGRFWPACTRLEYSVSRIVIRPIEIADAEQYTALLRYLDAESRFPVVSAFDRVMDAAQWRTFIARMKAAGLTEYFVAEEGPQLVGFLSTSNAGMADVRQLRIVIAIRRSHVGQGLGTRLFLVMETWARAAGIERLKLLVEANNERALGLYRKMGFAVEEVIERAVIVDGQPVDDLVMARRLA